MDLTNQIGLTEIAQKKVKRIFFYRVCGTGMGAAACLLKEKGYDVEGGDVNFFPPMSTYLQSTNILCHDLTNLDESYLKKFDLIVVGNVVAKKSDEASMIEALGVPFISFPSVLGGLILKDRNVVGVAGTHGKTTTTYFLAQIFEKLGYNPGYFIGGVLEGRPSSLLGSDSYFFIESDEYDSSYFEKISKFRPYNIDNLILTSLEFDHADIFNSIEDILEQFHHALPSIKESLIINGHYQAANSLFESYKKNAKKAFLYGDSLYHGPKNIDSSAEGCAFDIHFEGKDYRFKSNVVGKHNIENLSACILFALSEGIHSEKIAPCLLDLKLVKRRQEVRGHYKEALVIDDFAHHPKAISVTLDGLKTKYLQKKMVVVLAPNSATGRSSIFQGDYANSLNLADLLIIAIPPQSTTISNASDLDCGQLLNDWKNLTAKEGYLAKNLDELISLIDGTIDKESVLVILSNGTCLGLWESQFIHELKK